MRARVAFLGSPAFAVPCLEAMAGAHEVCLVLTQPVRPSGRGRKSEPTAVHKAAERLGLVVDVYERSRRRELDARLVALQLDVLVVVAFGAILKPSTLAAARCGAVNVHASLLPRWRGVAPIEHALWAGDPVTGVTFMVLDAGVDTGPTLGQRTVAIEPEDTRVSLAEKLSRHGAALAVALLGPYVSGAESPKPQPVEGACYAPRFEKHHGRIDWHQDARRIWQQVRALYGWPGAFTLLGETTVKVHAVRPVEAEASAPPGTIVCADEKHGVQVACGRHLLQLLELQLPGKTRAPAAALVHGRQLKVGDVFVAMPEGNP